MGCGWTTVCICGRCEMIPFAVGAVALAVTFDFSFSKLMKTHKSSKARLTSLLPAGRTKKC